MMLLNKKRTSLVSAACMLATLFTCAQPTQVYAGKDALPSTHTICPAGWGHGSRPNLGLLKLQCGDGQADLTTFTVETNELGVQAIARLDYAAPGDCFSDDGIYVVQVFAKEPDYRTTLTTFGHSGSVNIVMDIKDPVIGQQPLEVRISSDTCYADTFGKFEVVAVNELLGN